MKTTALRILLVLLPLALLPAAAQAFRPQCDSVCTCFSSCSQICYWGMLQSDCGFAGPCIDQCSGAAVAAPAKVADAAFLNALECDANRTVVGSGAHFQLIRPRGTAVEAPRGE